MTILTVLKSMMRHWILISLAVVVFGGSVFAFSFTRDKQYTATSQQFVTFMGANSPSQLAQGATYTQNQMQSFGQLATSPLVLQPVIDRLSLAMSVGDLRTELAVTTPRDTVILQIAATDSSPRRAAAIANAVADQLTSTVREIGPKQQQNRPLLAITTIQTAQVPASPSAPKTTRNTIFGMLIGVVLGAGAAHILTHYESRVRSPAGIARATSAPYLGSIRRSRRQKGLVVLRKPTSPAAEDFRQLRTGLHFITHGQTPITLMLTAPAGRAGSSTVSANLAAALAEAGRRVVLVDAQFREPAVARLTGARNAAGASNALLGEAPIDDVIQHVDDLGFDVVASGGIPPNPGEVVASGRLSAVLDELKQRYDYVLVDTPPVLPVADPAVLGTQADAVIIVANARMTQQTALSRAIQVLATAGVETAGVILNAAAPQVAHNVPELPRKIPRQPALTR